MEDNGDDGRPSVEQTWQEQQKKKIRYGSMAGSRRGIKRLSGADKKVRVKELCELFDRDKKGVVPQEEVGTIMRAMGVYPTEKQWVKDMLDEIQGDEPTAFVTYDRLEAKILELLSSHVCDADTDDTLLQAFRVLDSENLGYITVPKMRELLTTRGVTPFRDKEVDAFLAVAKDLETGHIYYEDYIRILMTALEVNDK